MEMGCGHEAELEALRRENAELRREVARIPKLQARIGELEQRIGPLKKKLEEAIRAQKRQAVPFSKGPPKTNPKKPGRKPGDLYGLKAHREPPAQVDETISVELPASCECGGELEYLETVAPYPTEIPRRPIHRRFDIQVGRCRDCGRVAGDGRPSPTCGRAAFWPCPRRRSPGGGEHMETGKGNGDMNNATFEGGRARRVTRSPR